MRNTLKKTAELTYAELTQGRESTRLPHTHKFTSLKNVIIFALHKIDKFIYEITSIITFNCSHNYSDIQQNATRKA